MSRPTIPPFTPPPHPRHNTTTSRSRSYNVVLASSTRELNAEKIRDIEDLKEVITRHFEELKADHELIKKVVRAVSGRIQECIAADGWHFEGKRK